MTIEKKAPNTSFQSILEEFRASLLMYTVTDSNNFISKILNVLAYKESLEKPKHEVQTIYQHKEMYINDNLWREIIKNEVKFTEKSEPVIGLPKLRIILEKYEILRDEKNGM